MKHILVLNIIIILIVFICSCSKDKDVIPPTIVVYSPVYQQEIEGVDTIQVLATVSDDRNIEYVTVSLRNENDIPVLSTVTKAPNKKDYYLNVFYFFDNLHLPPGHYDLRISAFDGENMTTEYVKILFDGTPKSRTGTFIVSNTGGSSDIYYLDNFYNSTSYKIITGDYIGSAVNSYDQQLLHASSGSFPSANINAFNLNSGTDLWNIPIINSAPISYYHSFLYDNRTIYLGKEQGGVDGYGANGIGNYNASVISGFQVEGILVHNDILVTEQKASMGGVIKLIPYWIASGIDVGINATFPPYEDVLDLFTKSANDIVVISNDAISNGNLTYYNPSIGSLTTHPIGLGKIDDCLTVGIGIYLVVNSGNVYKINTNSGFPFLTPVLYLSGVGANNIWYDDLTDELFVSSGSVLNIYDFSSTTLKGTYNHIDPIKEVLFWYNK